MKECPKCGEIVPVERFRKKNRHGQPIGWCRDCDRKANRKRYHEKDSTKKSTREASTRHYLKKLYGMTLEQYREMEEQQDYRCAICREPETQNRNLAVDHCHSTGKVRDLLCQSCNTAIGKLKDSPELIRAAADYIESHSSEKVTNHDDVCSRLRD